MPYVQGFLRIVNRDGLHPDNELPDGGNGNYPDNELPGGGHIDNSLPGGLPPIGSTLPEPPPGIWPPPSFTRPIVPVHPDNTLPVQPGTIWPPPGRPNRPDNSLPGSGNHPDNSLPSSCFWVVAGIPGIGWRYICVDPSLQVGNELPPTAQPKV
jgi:hypothetical protein